MSQISRVQQNTKVNLEKQKHFHRALDLNVNVGSETMRDLVDLYLEMKGVSLKQHVDDPFVSRTIKKYISLSPEQFQTLKSESPSLNKMDISLLTIILQNTFPNQLSQEANKCITAMKRIRNKLAHAVKVELDDDTIFNETRQSIMSLGNEISVRRKNYSRDLFNNINDIRRQEMVYSHCNLDRIKLNNEMYVVKVVEATSDDGGNNSCAWNIKIGLTKWVRQLTRGIDVSIFLQTLKEENVINDTTKRQIQVAYSYEEQMQLLVLHMMNETTVNLCKLCKCLRQTSPLMADLVENSNTDGKEVERYLKDHEEDKIKEILRENFIERKDKSVATELLHIFVEEHFGFTLSFKNIQTYLKAVFPDVRYTTEDFSFFGLTWKDDTLERIEDIPQNDTDDMNVSLMTCESFSHFLGKSIAKQLDERLRVPMSTAIREQTIAPSIFLDMTSDEMKDVFSPYIESSETNLKYGFGIKKFLEKVQSGMRQKSLVKDISESREILRNFDSPFTRQSYQRLQVQPDQGNLLIPAHEFASIPVNQRYLVHFAVKEVIKFTAACINGRKNGTIHFGIECCTNGTGNIKGIQNDKMWSYLEKEIGNAINVCFNENASVAFKCIRPPQFIPVAGDGIVIEIDVVPFSKYISKSFLQISFPPKGNQKQECFVYSLKPKANILPVCEKVLPETENFYENVLQERIKLEQFNDNTISRSNIQIVQLRKMLTGGNAYVTDSFVPIIVSGKLSGSSNSAGTLTILEEMNMAFTSSAIVFDCDNTVTLRKRIENNKRIFHVKTAEDLALQSDLSDLSPTWLYCNGNKELSREAMTIEDWIDNRAHGVRRAFEKMKSIIPNGRAKVIFLVFQSNKTENDLLREIARMAFVDYFKNQCIVLSDNEEIVTPVRKELVTLIGQQRLENTFHTGLNWKRISRLSRNIFKLNPAVVCKLPHCDGHFIEMTKVERESLDFTDIDIISGEECIDQEAQMTPEETRKNAIETQENFYHGRHVSWWNFYYKQVGERDQYLIHRNEIKDKLSNNKGENLIEEHLIEHHPGAGGSTLAMHLLWYFSQFRKTPENSYRCCIVKTSNVRDETINQIEKFRNFNDGECPKPFIILSDNINEENEQILKEKLNEAAYKTSYPGKLFCLLISVNRRPITYDETDGKPLLRHSLNRKEQVWFEEKYKQMEKNDDVDVETLIAFNLMRHSFDPEYMQKTVDRLMKGVTKKELRVLRCLALIRSYESGSRVPESVFDALMDNFEVDKLLPWGIIHSLPELQRLSQVRHELWNTRISRAMSLLVEKKTGPDFYSSGICIISQLLAREVIEYIQLHDNVSLEDIVHDVLDLVKTHCLEGNPFSKRFVKIVCSLFKTRQLLEGDGLEMKQKFSDLILKLKIARENEKEADANRRVLRAITRCFEITKDPLVGQQLARFNIKKYDEAEEAIERSLEIQCQNSYLWHTYGLIFKSNMEGMLTQTKTKICDTEAVKVIELAFEAIEKFVKCQQIAITTGENTTWGCFHTEVKTALSLLEKFHNFACYTDKQDFVSFLNEDLMNVADSPLLHLLSKCPKLQNLRVGSVTQRHLEYSLRSMEERSYQVKRQLYVVYSQDDTLLLGLRERFERFYGSHTSTSKYQFSYGIGLKPLMVAKVRNNKAFTIRVKEAKERLEQNTDQSVDERDLLVYLGDRIISISNQGPNTNNNCTLDEYKRLLSYSTKLIAKQTEATSFKRIYLETFLYYAMLHWPLKTRTTLNIEVISRPATFEQLLKKWEDSYNNNFYIKTIEQGKRYRPKNYFALGKGSPGNDIVDLESIKREWMDRKKKETGRVRKPVYKDFFWREPFVEERLERLEGVVDDSGYNITHEAEYAEVSHKFRIRTYYPCQELSNRSVTFVLGFTWKEPTAFDVVEIGNLRRLTPESKTPEFESDNASDEVNGGESGSKIIYERTQKTGEEPSGNSKKRRRRRRKHKR